jgi:hypothetical protein
MLCEDGAQSNGQLNTTKWKWRVAEQKAEEPQEEEPGYKSGSGRRTNGLDKE